MNFDFMMECEIKDPKIKAAYDEIYKELVDAEDGRCHDGSDQGYVPAF